VVDKDSHQSLHDFNFIYFLRYSQNAVRCQKERTLITIKVEARRPLSGLSLRNYVHRSLRFSDFELLNRHFTVLKCACCPSPQFCDWCGDCAFCTREEEDQEQQQEEEVRRSP
jgi:hypothetical protein